MISASDFDQRQYRRMLNSLNLFLAGSLSIGKLIADLEGLLKALEYLDDDWKKLYWQQWSYLEEARAISFERGDTKLNHEELKVAFDAANQVKLLVLEKVDDIHDHPDRIEPT